MELETLLFLNKPNEWSLEMSKCEPPCRGRMGWRWLSKPGEEAMLK